MQRLWLVCVVASAFAAAGMWREWGGHSDAAASTGLSIPVSGQVCVRDSSSWTLVSASGECQVIGFTGDTCEAVTTNSTYRIRVPYTLAGIDQVTVTWISGVEVEPAIEPSKLNLRRGLLREDRGDHASHCPSKDPKAEPVPNWSFTDDPSGNVIMLNPNPYRTVLFYLPTLNSVERGPL